MTKTYTIVAALTCLAVASLAATEILVPDTTHVIDITVAPDRLDECRQTLRDVAQQPAVHDNGSMMLFDYANDLPTVRCVADTSV